MKKILFIATIIGIVLASCKKDKDDDPVVVSMVTKAPEVLIGLAGAGNTLIDWGDGTKEKNNISGEWLSYTYDYSDAATSHTITITGKMITGMDCNSNQLTSLDVSKNTKMTFLNCSENQLTSLDVSTNTTLTSLSCHNNQLTSLDVSRNTALRWLYCYNNLLDADALDYLFGTLNSIYGEKFIYIGGNGPNYDGSGTYNCDKSIAEDKGWIVKNR